MPPGWEGAIELSRFTQYVPGEPVGAFIHAQAEFLHEEEGLWLDAGSRVRLTGPGGELELVRTAVPGKTVYQKESGTDIDPAFFVNEGSYDLDVAGSSRDYGVPGFELAGVLTIPQALTLTAPDVTSGELVIAAAATTLALTWVPGDGDYVDVIFAVATSAGTGEYLSYRVADDGNFDVPALGLSGLPAGQGAFTIARKIDTPLVFPEDGTGEGLGSDAIQCLLVRE